MHLLDSTGCRTFICTDASEFVVRTFETEWKKLRISHIPNIEDWFNDEPTEPYIYDKEWDVAKDEPTLIFPTGGTTGSKNLQTPFAVILTFTGLPRPIVYTNSMMTVFDAGNFLPNPEEFVYNHFANRRVYSSLPAMTVRISLLHSFTLSLCSLITCLGHWYVLSSPAYSILGHDFGHGSCY